MALPVVAIIGRPNVGKSSLLNCLAGEMISIVDPTAGITRDRVAVMCVHTDTCFELVDTGGLGVEDPDALTEHIEQQIRFAIDQASLVLFVTDALAGVQPLDRTVAELLRRSQRPVLLVANKVDTPAHEAAAAEFAALGFGEPRCISALHHLGREPLLEAIVAHLANVERQRPDEPAMHLAIVGKRNAGKSTLINALAGEPRVIVSEVPGTTRDAVDVRFQRNEQVFVAIDTAGVHRKARQASGLEFYSYHRALRSIQRADVVLMLVDAAEPLGRVDKRLAHTIAEQHKPVVLVVNKWDLAKGRANTSDYGEYLTRLLPEIAYAPITFTVATRAEQVWPTIDLARALFKQARTRVETATLNAALAEATAGRRPTHRRSRIPKIYYGTQVAVAPPTFVLFVNDPARVDEGFERFLANRLRELLPLPEVPIRMLFRPRRREQRAAAR